MHKELLHLNNKNISSAIKWGKDSNRYLSKENMRMVNKLKNMIRILCD